MEVLIVVVIISILAGLSIVYGTKPLEAAKAKAAKAMLQTIYAAEKEYCIHNDTYADLSALIAERYLDDPNDPDQRDWSYSTPSVGGASPPNDCGTFTAEASRQGTGHNFGETITIDQDNGPPVCSTSEFGC